jgi:hypothetical protein
MEVFEPKFSQNWDIGILKTGKIVFALVFDWFQPDLTRPNLSAWKQTQSIPKHWK